MKRCSTLCSLLAAVAIAACGEDDTTAPSHEAAGSGGTSGTSGASGSGTGGTSASAGAAGSSAAGSSASGGAAGGPPLPSADFDARCNAPGVIVCRGFDSEDELSQTNSETTTGVQADSNGTLDHIGIDTAIKTSGSGALRFEIASQTPANHSGAFRQLMGQEFGENSIFYAQFRLRLSTDFVETPWDDVVGSSPKIVLFHHHSATCNDIEWAQVMSGWHGHIAEMYTDCGQYAPKVKLPDGTTLLQQGDYQCAYGTDYASDPSCFRYPPETWMTFYYKATIGQWGEANSELEAWVSVDGKPYQQWIDAPGFTLYAAGETTAGFDSVYLTTYMTSKDSSADHPTAYAWYDELIVSTEPIAVPAASP